MSAQGFRLGKVGVTVTLLHELLRLPADVKIEGVEQRIEGIRKGVFEVYVSGPQVPEAADENITPLLRCVFAPDDKGKWRVVGFERASR